MLGEIRKKHKTNRFKGRVIDFPASAPIPVCFDIVKYN